MNIRFYNKMDFPINLRKVWEPDAPAITLKAGGIIEGPYDTLSEFYFLAPLTSDFSMVDSMTQNEKMEYKDVIINETAPLERYIIPNQNVLSDEYKPYVYTQSIPDPEPTLELPPEPIKIEEKVEIKELINQNELETDIIQKEIPQIKEVKSEIVEEINTVEFDPKSVNWLTVKVDQLERACKALNIDMTSLINKKPKEKKWELVKLIKNYYKI